ncbi:MAG: hypothetical protein JWN34_3136, partial [Bryobacterales bacterium]|nr:hypothetical protein [Bryobacterales bacterium]
DSSFRLAATRSQNNAATKGDLLRRAKRDQPLLNLPLLILRNGKNRRHSGHVSVYADLRFTSSYLLDTTLGISAAGAPTMWAGAAR